MVSDADFAFKAALRRPPLTRSAHLNRIRLRAGQVTAVCGAAPNGCVFAGFADGAWTRFDPETGDPSFWRAEKDNNGAVTALATDPGGNLLVVLSTSTRDNQVLASYLCELGTYRLRSRPLPLVHGPA